MIAQPRPQPQPKEPPLSAKAQRLGLQTVADCWKEHEDAKRGWSGTNTPPELLEYHCPICGKDFNSPSGARKHMKTNNHPVLRMDWY